MKLKINKLKIKSIYLSILLLVIISIAILLRIYRFEQNFVFTGEVGHNLLAIKNAYLNRQIPLLGPPTSHPWLYFGPFFYWVYGPVLILSNFNPLSHAYFGVAVSIFTIILNYFVVNKLFNERIALISSFLITISPLFIEYARYGRFFSIITLLVYPLLYLLFQIIVYKRNLFLHLGLVFGMMFSFHYTPLMLVPFIMSVFVIKKRIPDIRSVFLFLTGVFITTLPFMIYDLQNSFSMSKNLFLWIPYRILGFIGLIPKNNITVEVVKSNSISFTEYISKSFIMHTSVFSSSLLVFIFVLIICIYFRRIMNIKKFKFPYLFIQLWFLWGILAVFIHGSPPVHYYVPIFSAPIIIASVNLDLILKKDLKGLLAVVFFSILSLVNLSYYNSDKWFYKSEDIISEKPYYVPYKIQKEMIKSIVSDSGKNKFKLKRFGMYDQFEGDYAQNYTYLLWLEGNEPVMHTDFEYSINENMNHENRDSKIIYKNSNITIRRRSERL